MVTTKKYSSKSKINKTFSDSYAWNVSGSSYDDKITGGKYNDLLYGYNGNDYINGKAGNDTIYGGNGNDTIYGDNDNDKLYGENGNDTIYGGNGNDYINGGNDNDKLYGDSGNDTIFGGLGNDTITGGSGTNTLQYKFKDGKFGNDTINLTKGETIRLDFANSDIMNYISCTQSGSDLKLTVYNKKRTDKSKSELGTICLKNALNMIGSTKVSVYNGSKEIKSDILKSETSSMLPIVTTMSINKSSSAQNVVKFSDTIGNIKFYRQFTNSKNLVIEEKLETAKKIVIVKDYFAKDNKSKTYYQFANGEKQLINVVKSNLGYYLEQSSNFKSDGYVRIDNYIENGDSNIDRNFELMDSKYTTKIDYTIYGSDKDDYLTLNKYNNQIFTGKGNDTINIKSTSGKNYILEGTQADIYQQDIDTYIFNNLNSYNHIITTYSQSEHLNNFSDIFDFKNTSKSDINLFFNVTKEGYEDIQYSYSPNACVILNNKNKTSILNGTKKLTTGIYYTDYKDLSKMQIVSSNTTLSDTIKDFGTKIKYLTPFIQEYLEDKPYTSAFELFEKGTTNEKKGLYNIYQKSINSNWLNSGLTITVDNDNSYIGGNGNDTFNIDSYSAATIYAGNGDDTFNMAGNYYNRNLSLFGEKGNDTYQFDQITYCKNVVISDSQGTDRLLFNNSVMYTTAKFDVTLNKNENGSVIKNDSDATYSIGNDLEFMYDYSMTTGEFINNDSNLIIQNYFGEGKIETVKGQHYYGYDTLSEEYINSLAQSVANWLANDGRFDSAYQAFDSGEDVADLANIYLTTNVWS